jgi:hypothetical protein
MSQDHTVFRELAQRKERKIEEGHLMLDHAYADIDGGDRVFEGEAECGTQAAQFSWPQILGEGLLRFDGRAKRGDDPR